MRVLELCNVTKRFGDFTAVDDLSMTVDRGQIVSLLGPSGCGKTTTLRMIAGFESVDQGAILIADRDIRNKRPYERNVGLLFQDYALFPHMTVEKNVAYGLRQRGGTRSQIAARTAEMLDLVRMTEFAARRPRQLSGGQQQRVALARTLATNPEIILLDEPLSALDAKLRQQLRAELKQILEAVGASTIVVTHDQEEAMSLAEHIIVIERGRIVQQGSPSDIYAAPKCKFVAEFVGRSNWFGGTLGSRVGDSLREYRCDNGLTILVVEPDDDGTRFEACIRPERIVVAERTAANASAGDLNVIAGTVVDIAYLGPDLQLQIDIGGGEPLEVVEKNVGQPLRRRGQNVSVRFRAEDVVIVPMNSS